MGHGNYTIRCGFVTPSAHQRYTIRPHSKRGTRAALAGSDLHMNALPSVALTQRFLALCQQQGSQRLAVGMVAVGRSTGVSGLPESDDWTEWDAEEMRAAVEYLERMRIR